MKSFNCVRSKTPNPSASASQNSKLGGDSTIGGDITFNSNDVVVKQFVITTEKKIKPVIGNERKKEA